MRRGWAQELGAAAGRAEDTPARQESPDCVTGTDDVRVRRCNDVRCHDERLSTNSTIRHAAPGRKW